MALRSHSQTDLTEQIAVVEEQSVASSASQEQIQALQAQMNGLNARLEAKRAEARQRDEQAQARQEADRAEARQRDEQTRQQMAQMMALLQASNARQPQVATQATPQDAQNTAQVPQVPVQGPGPSQRAASVRHPGYQAAAHVDRLLPRMEKNGVKSGRITAT